MPETPTDQPTRRRERQMQRFKSAGQAREFLSAHAPIYGHFHPHRHRIASSDYTGMRTEAFTISQQETCGRKEA